MDIREALKRINERMSKPVNVDTSKYTIVNRALIDRLYTNNESEIGRNLKVRFVVQDKDAIEKKVMADINKQELLRKLRPNTPQVELIKCDSETVATIIDNVATVYSAKPFVLEDPAVTGIRGSNEQVVGTKPFTQRKFVELDLTNVLYCSPDNLAVAFAESTFTHKLLLGDNASMIKNFHMAFAYSKLYDGVDLTGIDIGKIKMFTATFEGAVIKNFDFSIITGAEDAVFASFLGNAHVYCDCDLRNLSIDDPEDFNEAIHYMVVYNNRVIDDSKGSSKNSTNMQVTNSRLILPRRFEKYADVILENVQVESGEIYWA